MVGGFVGWGEARGACSTETLDTQRGGLKKKSFESWTGSGLSQALAGGDRAETGGVLEFWFLIGGKRNRKLGLTGGSRDGAREG